MIARRVLVAWIVVVAALASGCSSSGGTGGPAAPPSAGSPSSAGPIAAGAGVCDYLTPADVHGFGQNVSYPGKRGHDYDFGPSCDYGGAVFTLVEHDVSAAAFTAETRPVSGVGDRAYYGSEWHWLRVVSGRTRFQLRCLLCKEPELATMTAVAKSVIARLPAQ
jgi:hypothetical protein